MVCDVVGSTPRAAPIRRPPVGDTADCLGRGRCRVLGCGSIGLGVDHSRVTLHGLQVLPAGHSDGCCSLAALASQYAQGPSRARRVHGGRAPTARWGVPRCLLRLSPKSLPPLPLQAALRSDSLQVGQGRTPARSPARTTMDGSSGQPVVDRRRLFGRRLPHRHSHPCQRPPAIPLRPPKWARKPATGIAGDAGIAQLPSLPPCTQYSPFLLSFK